MINKDTIFISLSVAVLLFLSVTIRAEGTVLSNSNKELFISPLSLSLSASDIVFENSGAPQTNPATAGSKPRNSAMVSYANFYHNVFSTSVASYTGAIDENSGFGVSLSYLLVPDIPDNRNLQLTPDGNPIYDTALVSYFSSSEIFLHVGYGRTFALPYGFQVSAGLAINSQRRRLTSEDIGYGIGTDGGLIVEGPVKGLKAGLLLENLTTHYIRWDSENSDVALPHGFAGIGYSHYIQNLHIKLQGTVKSADVFSNSGPLIVKEETAESTDDISAWKDTTDTPLYFRPLEKPGLFFGASVFGIEARTGNPKRAEGALRLGGSFVNLASLFMNIFTEFPYYSTRSFSFGAGVYLYENTVCIDLAYLRNTDFPGTYQIAASYQW